MRRRLVQFVLSVFSTLLHHVQGRDQLRRALPKAGAAPRAPMFDDGVVGEFPGVTAYYERFNERRWFSSEVANGGVDPTHRGVSDRWLEYQGLSELDHYYDEAWIDKHLLMQRANTYEHSLTGTHSLPGQSRCFLIFASAR